MYYAPKGSEIDATRYPDLRKWVVGCLSGHKKPNDIIFQLCRRTGWDWGQAKRFVEQVVEMDQKQVHRQRMPLLLGIGLLMVVGGIVAFLPAFMDLIATLSLIEPPLDGEKFMTLVINARGGYVRIIRLVTGLAMFVGGGYGIISAVKSAMTGEGEDLLKPQTPPQA
ncbi:MAG: hypothetical protein WBM17_11585 [Anaerolineales bacterium]